MLDPMNGSCVVPPVADLNGTPTCPMLNESLAMVSLKLFPVGCIATQGQMGMSMGAGTINKTDCMTIPGAQWMKRAMVQYSPSQSLTSSYTALHRIT